MVFGFIGTGAITEHLIIGLLESGAFSGEVIVSKRSEFRSSRLAERFEQVTVESDNQKLVDAADWVFLSVLPPQVPDVLADVTFRADHRVISLVGGRTVESLGELCAPATDLFRIIPMPPIELGVGPMPLFPPDQMIADLFNQFGSVIEIEDEERFTAFLAQSGSMSNFFELVASQARWLQQHGASAENATLQVTALYRALSEMAFRAGPVELQELPDASTTKGGLNEQVLKESRDEGWFDGLDQRLDRIVDRLEAAKKSSL